MNIFYNVKKEHNHEFLQVFYHNVRPGKSNFFIDKKEANFSLNKNKFSLLKYIDSDFIVDNSKYEFILEYPEYNASIYFSQETSIFENVTDTKYSIIYQSEETANFKGLSLSTSSSTFIDGQPYSIDWWYSIGSIDSYDNYYIPGPYLRVDGSFKSRLTKELSLWIRCDSLVLMKKFPIIYSIFSVKIYSKNTHYLTSYMFILISVK